MGGLVVFWFAPVVVVPISISPHVIFCKVEVPGKEIKYIIFVYGSPHPTDRYLVWDEISTILQSTPSAVLLGDFNQVEYLSDKIGESLDIPGRHLFQDWKINSQLLDIPFSGPLITWTNGQLQNPTYERIDKGFATGLWLDSHPDAVIFHQPILFSDHATIILRGDGGYIPRKRPYKIENWCLGMYEVSGLVTSKWKDFRPGSQMLLVSRKLEDLKRSLLSWCVSHKKQWGIDWKDLQASIDVGSFPLCDSSNRESFLRLCQQKIVQAQTAFLFWKQQCKTRWDALGDTHSRLLFRSVQTRRRRNKIMSLRDEKGVWVSDHAGISSTLESHFSGIYNCYNSSPPPAICDWDRLGILSLSALDCQFLLEPFSASEIIRVMLRLFSTSLLMVIY